MRRGKLRRSRRQCYLLSVLFLLSCSVGLKQILSLNQVSDDMFQDSLSTEFQIKLSESQKVLITDEKNITNATATRDEIEIFTHANFSVEFPLCLVHVGKAGGSSISCGLGLMYANCEGMPREKIPHTHFFHMRRNNCPKKKTRTYVVTVRNPITRIKSWFDFEKNRIPFDADKQRQETVIRERGRLFKECYSEFENLASIGLQPSGIVNNSISASNVEDMTCPERAWAAILGARPFSYHEWYNYEYYWTGLQNHQSLLASDKKNHRPGDTGRTVKILRSEHLSEDWSRISSEPLFRHVNQGPKTTTTAAASAAAAASDNKKNQTRIGSSFLSEEAMQNLCRALCPEIQFYKRFLLVGNLNQEQIHESIQELSLLCPMETIHLRNCSDIPTFPAMKIPKRQYKLAIKKRFYKPY